MARLLINLDPFLQTLLIQIIYYCMNRGSFIVRCVAIDFNVHNLHNLTINDHKVIWEDFVPCNTIFMISPLENWHENDNPCRNVHVGATSMAWPSLDFLSLQLHTKPIEDSKWSTEEISFTSSLPYVYFHLSMHTIVFWYRYLHPE